MNSISPLITPTELQQRLTSPSERTAVIDASWHLPNVNRSARDEHQAERIPGAVFFDLDQVSDLESDLPHMLPSADVFSKAMAELGVGADHHVVVYDSYGLFSAARLWWMFLVFGHQKVQLLDGGLPGWKAIDAPLENGLADVIPATHALSLELNAAAVADLSSVTNVIGDGVTRILDARAKARFDAAVPEPRPGLRSGHMPGAISMPFTELLHADANDVMRLKSALELTEIFENHGVNKTDPVVTTCGSGVTAAVLSLALEIAGYDQGALYDGSWTEWGGRTDTEIVS